MNSNELDTLRRELARRVQPLFDWFEQADKKHPGSTASLALSLSAILHILDGLLGTYAQHDDRLHQLCADMHQMIGRYLRSDVH